MMNLRGKTPLLPLQGSNLDSSDPECLAASDGGGQGQGVEGSKDGHRTPEDAAGPRTALRSHDIRHDATAYHKAWRQGEGREKFAAAVRRYQQRNPEKRRAHWAVDNAIRAGKLQRGACEQAGADCAGRIEAHHEDYSRPLEVRWLCKRHHRAADRERQAREATAPLAAYGVTL